jgi:hypothetical protein
VPLGDWAAYILSIITSISIKNITISFFNIHFLV